MNNNRNNRRRGRGNRNQGGANSQNRIDSRARGNAPQLLDKYKKLAQDAQHNGDRVQAEYYLQFADHYFRVIADNKARQDEARAKRNEEREQSGEDGDDGEDGGNRRRNNRRGRSRRDENDAVSEGEIGTEGEAVSEGEAASEESEEPKRRTRKPRGEGRTTRRKRSDAKADDGDNSAEIDQSVLPPAIGQDEGPSGDSDDLEAVG
ncbi:MAG: DUF4167 domain-containing protein [Pseudomonadota bacterium]